MQIENVIETSNLTKSFGKDIAVDSVTLKVPARSIYGFLGPNGAGKTTTIKLLINLLNINKGDIKIFGKSLKKYHREILKDVGSLVEQPALYAHLNARENLEISRIVRGVHIDRIDEVLEIVGLTEAASKKVGKFSQGMKQRLGIANALLDNPKLLILDEPTNGLDPEGIKEIRELLGRLPQERGITVFLSTHLLHEVEKVATHVGIIRKGKLIFQDNIQKLIDLKFEGIEIDVDSLDSSLRLLNKMGLNPRSNGNTVKLDAEDKDRVAEINKRLVEKSIKVYKISPSELTLEDIFLKIVK